MFEPIVPYICPATSPSVFRAPTPGALRARADSKRSKYQ